MHGGGWQAIPLRMIFHYKIICLIFLLCLKGQHIPSCYNSGHHSLHVHTTVLIKKSCRTLPCLICSTSYYSPYFLLPDQNYRANVALMLQSYIYRTSNATYGIIGVVVNNKKSNIREISS